MSKRKSGSKRRVTADRRSRTARPRGASGEDRLPERAAQSHTAGAEPTAEDRATAAPTPNAFTRPSATQSATQKTPGDRRPPAIGVASGALAGAGPRRARAPQLRPSPPRVDPAAEPVDPATVAAAPRGGARPSATTLSRAPRLALGSGQHRVEFARSPLRILRDVEPQALGVTYWFDAAPSGDPYPVRVAVTGRLRGSAAPGRKDAFSVVGVVENVLPGSGRVAMTVRAQDLAPGTWDVTATPVEPAAAGGKGSWVEVEDARLPVVRATGTTTFAPVARVLAPGARLGVWPALVAAGAVLALVLQAVLVQRLGVPVQRLLPLSGLACLLGLLGAKAYYLLTHRSEPRGLVVTGMSIQGFVLVAIGTLLGGVLLLGLPVGTVLDVTTPGILGGMAVGRLGCLLAGCCVGRPTSSCWGLWSSDRRLGLRRIPVQLMESALAGVLALFTLLAVLAGGPWSDGVVFVAGFAAYTAGRQVLFPLRGIRRATAHGRAITLMVSSAVLLGSLVAVGLGWLSG